MLRGFHAMIRKMSRVDTSQKNFSTLPGWKKKRFSFSRSVWWSRMFVKHDVFGHLHVGTYDQT